MINKTIEETIKTEPQNYAFFSGVLIGYLSSIRIELDIADEYQCAVNTEQIQKLVDQAFAVIRLHEEANK